LNNLLVRLFVKRYHDQEIAKWPFWSSIQATTYYYLSNHSR